ncbi:MAG TPA: DNA primase, partial [Actinomycetota bacterium]|nr:DNA primase [Actinomycetota bacterium]
CPFHAEKTPSFSLDPAKGLWHCFGCGEGGDTIRLIEKIENLSFVEAIERLAQMTGVDLQYEQLSTADRAAHRRRARLVDAHREAATYYHETLKRASEASDARTYLLQQRGFTKETLEEFQVGFSLPKWDALVGHLKGKGFSEQEIADAGLGARRQDGGLVDRFRGRVMFPIHDLTGDPVAFGARKMGTEDGPKYLNSAESPIYKKSQVLYALNRAKGEIVKTARGLIVEGYTDVIALHQAGIQTAVATCGTALGLEHLRGLQRFTQDVVLSLDADEAGGLAAERTYDQMVGDAQQMGITLRVVVMPPGDDPADSVTKAGADGFLALVDGAVPLLEFVLKREADRYSVGDAEVQARALRSSLRLLAKTDNPVVRNEAARRLSGWIGVDPSIVFVELEKVMTTGTTSRSGTGTILRRASGQVRREQEALRLALQQQRVVKARMEEVSTEFFSVPEHKVIWTALQKGTDPALLPETLEDERTRNIATQLAVEPIPLDGEQTDAVIERYAIDVFSRLKEFVLSREIEQLTPQLQRLNPLESPKEHDKLFAKLLELQKQKRELTQMGEGDE